MNELETSSLINILTSAKEMLEEITEECEEFLVMESDAKPLTTSRELTRLIEGLEVWLSKSSEDPHQEHNSAYLADIYRGLK